MDGGDRKSRAVVQFFLGHLFLVLLWRRQVKTHRAHLRYCSRTKQKVGNKLSQFTILSG